MCKKKSKVMISLILTLVILTTFVPLETFSQGLSSNVIKGIVFIDSNGNGYKDDSEQVLKNIRINLFSAEEVDLNEGIEGVVVYKEKLAATTKTDEKGQYTFNVSAGMYSVNLDIEDLPSGIGVIEPNIFIHEVSDKGYNFIARAVASIDIANDVSKVIYINDEVPLSPVLKDKFGNTLVGKVNYMTDDTEVSLDKNVCKVKIKKLKNKKANVKVVSGNVSKEISLDFVVPNTTSVGKVKLAYDMGIIDEKTKILYYLYSLFDEKNFLMNSGLTLTSF